MINSLFLDHLIMKAMAVIQVSLWVVIMVSGSFMPWSGSNQRVLDSIYRVHKLINFLLSVAKWLSPSQKSVQLKTCSKLKA